MCWHRDAAGRTCWYRLYWLLKMIPQTRESAQRLGLVTREQMIVALAWAVENPANGIRVLEVPAIRGAKLSA